MRHCESVRTPVKIMLGCTVGAWVLVLLADRTLGEPGRSDVAWYFVVASVATAVTAHEVRKDRRRNRPRL